MTTTEGGDIDAERVPLETPYVRLEEPSEVDADEDHDAVYAVAVPDGVQTEVVPGFGNVWRRCRICLESELPGETGYEYLATPCNCRGSMWHVHPGCLEKWRRYSGVWENWYRCQQCRGWYADPLSVRLFIGRLLDDDQFLFICMLVGGQIAIIIFCFMVQFGVWGGWSTLGFQGVGGDAGWTSDTGAGAGSKEQMGSTLRAMQDQVTPVDSKSS